jgi:guanine nucleotide-binding protein G(i) subunit alpha
MPENFAESITSVWADPIIPDVQERSSEYYLMDSAGYFFESATRICRRDYVPTTNDVLRARVKTTGVSETRFLMGPLFIQ